MDQPETDPQDSARFSSVPIAATKGTTLSGRLSHDPQGLVETVVREGANERERVLAIYRDWQRALRGAALPLWLRRSGREIAAGLALFSFVFLTFLDEPLWSFRLFTNPAMPWVFLAPRSGTAVMLVFLLVWAINTWLLHGFLEQTTREPWRYRRWISTLRSVLAGFPQFGLLIVPAWRWIQQTGPSWAVRRDPVLPGQLLSYQGARPGRRSTSVVSFAWLAVSGFGACALVVLWTMKRALENPAHRTETLFLSVPMRLATFAILLIYYRSKAIRESAPPLLNRLALGASFSLLIPVPFVAVLGVLPPLLLEPSTAHSATLLWQVLARREGVGRLPLWLALEDALRKGWSELSLTERLWRPPRAVRSGGEIQKGQSQVLKLYDLQTFALIFDAAVLGWGLSWLTSTQPARVLAMNLIFQIVWIGCLGLCVVGICLSAAHFILLLLHRPSPLRVLDRQPYARYLSRTQLAMAAGLFLGSYVQQGKVTDAGILLMYACSLLVTVAGASLIFLTVLPKTPLSRESFRDRVLEVALLFVLMPVFGLGGPLDLLPRLFIIWVGLAPVRVWLLSRTLLPWLLRPFTLRDVITPDLPDRIRWQLGVLSTSALLPFGGLTILWCIWIRHKRWPDAEDLAWRRQPC